MKKNDTSADASALRNHAETEASQRKELSDHDIRHLSDEEIRHLVHELHVHQIELEIQNEELRNKHNKLEEAYCNLEALQRKYYELYDLAPAGYFTLGEKGEILETNFTGAALLGMERGTLTGQPITHFIHRESQDAFYFHRMKVFETKAHQICEIRMKKADGTPFHALLGSAVSQTGTSTPKIWRMAVTDISEQVRLEAELRHAHKMEAVGTLAGGIAHEFNNVLFPVIGYTQLLMQDAPEHSQIHEDLKQIFTSALRAKELVRQILNFSHTDDKSQHRSMKIQTVIEEAVSMLRASLPATVEICEDIDMNTGSVIGNAAQICQVIMNLCTNAYHALPDEKGIITIRLAQVTVDKLSDMKLNSGTYVRLTVTDTGHGMEPHIIERIFDPYFTTKEVGKGTGMGLSVVHGIVMSHDGEIEVRSDPGQGTAFYIWLPVISVKAVSEPEPACSDPLPRGSERILFVDDEEQITGMMTYALERLGYEITALNSSTDALELFRMEPDRFDLVITDMGMPRMPGDELAEQLLNIRPDIPIIICTGFSHRITEEKIKALGIRSLMMKPVCVRDVADTIRKVLDEK
ncbi:hybrid sensor histidine kinase/response regulator [Desulfonema magnum]|uniref:histidine kinase n=1 Tax=Desulfonema magnum TaxID=45655 RepID=A0A975GQ04_9BACT|nr:ATP-binding protein [Desulfonema magnum]QTA89546.1 Two component system response regulator/histidine kinase, PAS domain-containing [Desulfonema magnum]